jgi:hypothetical protein
MTVSSKRKPTAPDGVLARTYQLAMRLWDAQAADGLSRAHRLVGLEKTLRAAWPQTREWKYLCASCHDYGLVMSVCAGDATCGRLKEHAPHEFGRPCWCQAGAKFREKPPADPGTATTRAAKSKPMVRIGR